MSAPAFDAKHLKEGVSLYGQSCHREPVAGRRNVFCFQRGMAGRDKDDSVEADRHPGLFRNTKMTEVDGVKGAAEYTDLQPAGILVPAQRGDIRGAFVTKIPDTHLFPELAVTQNDELCAGQFLQPHGTAGMDFVGRNADLCSEAKLEAVVQAGRGIDQHCR